MKSSSKALLWLALLLAMLVVGGVLFFQPSPSDEVQITNQLEAARAAGERHDIGGIMKVISEKYQDANGLNPISLRAYLSQHQGANEPVQVTQSIPTVSIQGDTATSTSHLRVVTTADNRVVYDHDITIHWRREDGARFWVIPTKVWRAVSADYGGIMGD